MILVTGPTGSGKSTTLYAALHLLRSPSVSILTIEDPVEYMMEGINQVQVNPRVGRTFAGCLRSMLRQDPNVIMLGEIRDSETAEIAMEVSQTGHLVLSTLHTNDSVGAITRLLDLKIPAFLLTSSVTAIVAQRLVRKLCRCKRKERLPAHKSAELAAAGVPNCPSIFICRWDARNAIRLDTRAASEFMKCWCWTRSSRTRSPPARATTRSAPWPAAWA